NSWYGSLMPGDYAYRYMKMAGELFPESVLLNINDYSSDKRYVNLVKDLLTRGCRIDVVGSQMHLFKPEDCLKIGDGEKGRRPVNSPQQIRDTMNLLSQLNRPIHLSEITITSPGDDERGKAIQAVVARNLYRTWFSIKPMMGITWWNVVDDCGAPGEPTISGIFTRDMQPKPSYYELNRLINDEWKTRETLKAGQDGTVKFRGFKGNYRVTYKNAAGSEQTAEFHLSEDGDGV
ncbi:MAG: endo-1,4-beta-xylanase, partial [Kiritimatiellia bacterium]